MKCNKCNHYVYEPYVGCDWCMLPQEIKDCIDHIDSAADSLRKAAKIRNEWEWFEKYLKNLALIRIDVLSEAMAELAMEEE